MQKITHLKVTGNKIELQFESGESAEVYKFGKELYSTTSENLHKSTLSEFKQSIKELGFSEKELKQKWLLK